MTLKYYLFIIFALTLLSLGVFLSILFNIDPEKADFLTIVVFFISLLVFLIGFITFSGFYLRVYFSNNEVIYTNLPIAFRQAVLTSLAAVGLLVFSTMKTISLSISLSYILALVILELYFRSRKLDNKIKN